MKQGRQAGSRNPVGLSPAGRLTLFCALLSLLLSLILAAPFFPWAIGPEVRLDAPAPYTIKSPVTVRYVSKILTEADREAAAQSVAEVYRFDPTITVQKRQAFSDTLQMIGNILGNLDLSPEERQRQIAGLPEVHWTTEALALLSTLSDEEWSEIRKEALRLYDQVTYAPLEPQGVPQLRAQDIEKLREGLLNRVTPLLPLSKRRLVAELVSSFLVPNYVVDEAATEQRRQEARARTPDHYVDVLEGEMIVAEGQRVRELDLEKLEATGLLAPRGSWVRVAGQAVLAVGLLAALGLYLYRLQEKPYGVRDLLLIGLVMVVATLGARLLVPNRVGTAYAFPLPTASILLTLLLNPQVALGATVVLALLVGQMGGGTLGLELICLGVVGGLAGIYGIWKAQRSSAFLLTGAYITLAGLVVAGAFRLITQELSPTELLKVAAACAINGFASAALSFATFGLLGTVFGRITVLQLMELSNPNHPLLHRLMQEAPGTYYHSIIVGNLAERAAEVIGADPLLVRVGAYFHDIGKLARPYFFIDNQAGRTNIHDELPPSTSAKIIIDHVREGLELARKHRLPAQIAQFIPQHHGTTTAAYFYQRALQEEETVNPEDYRYPGPRPQSREAAILMLADSVEATVRSLSQSGKLQEALEKKKEGEDPLAKLVAGIIEQRVREGQLDESDLTFRDLRQIGRAFTEVLHGVYHPRVLYPEMGRAEERHPEAEK